MPMCRPTPLSPATPHASLTPAFVVETLRPFLRPARRRRIERVIAQRLISVTVVLEVPADPHNAAAVLRTAEAYGLLHVHIVPGSEGVSFSKKITVGAEKWLNVYRHADIECCLTWLRARRFCIFGAAPPARDAPSDAGGRMMFPQRPIALVLGNEHQGLSAAARRGCDHLLHLPMAGFCESLNLSVAAALFVDRVVTLRRQTLGAQGDLGETALMQLRAAYYAASTPHAAALVRKRLSV